MESETKSAAAEIKDLFAVLDEIEELHLKILTGAQTVTSESSISGAAKSSSSFAPESIDSLLGQYLELEQEKRDTSPAAELFEYPEPVEVSDAAPVIESVPYQAEIPELAAELTDTEPVTVEAAAPDITASEPDFAQPQEYQPAYNLPEISEAAPEPIAEAFAELNADLNPESDLLFSSDPVLEDAAITDDLLPPAFDDVYIPDDADESAYRTPRVRIRRGRPVVRVVSTILMVPVAVILILSAFFAVIKMAGTTHVFDITLIPVQNVWDDYDIFDEGMLLIADQSRVDFLTAGDYVDYYYKDESGNIVSRIGRIAEITPHYNGGKMTTYQISAVASNDANSNEASAQDLVYSDNVLGGITWRINGVSSLAVFCFNYIYYFFAASLLIFAALIIVRIRANRFKL